MPITTSTHTLIIGADSRQRHNYTNPAPLELILELGIDPIVNRVVAIGISKATNLLTGKPISPKRLSKLVPPQRLLQAIQRYQWAIENDDDAPDELRQLLHNVGGLSHAPDKWERIPHLPSGNQPPNLEN